MLLNVSNTVAEDTAEVNLIRIFETFSSMSIQPPDKYSHTSTVGGMIAIYRIVMLFLLVIA